MTPALSGTSRCDVPARVVAGGIAPLNAALTAQRAVPAFKRFLSALVFLLLLSSSRSSAAESNHWTILRDIEYARVGERALKLDLHVPREKAKSPLIVWVHG